VPGLGCAGPGANVERVDLERFVTAQDSGGTYQQAVAELREGRKPSHWMWFIFPQIVGLGRSATAQAYAINNLAEAQAYLAHPVLGPRLVECAQLVASHRGLSAEQIFGGIDAIKLRSSMTLFAHADPDQKVFGQVIDQYFEDPDPETVRRV
jgi:uncharacterized protein (DUF1810 family)